MSSLHNSAVAAEDVANILVQQIDWERLRGQTVLVTGATGMIPAYAVLALLEADRRLNLDLTVVALARNKDKVRTTFGSLTECNNLRLLCQDVTDPIHYEGNINHVIHGASAARPKLHATNPVGTIKANMLGTINLLDLCREHGAETFTLMSSAEVYGNVAPDLSAIKEDDYGPLDILNPRACYSEGKRAAETLGAVYQQQHGIRFTAARFGHIYGPGLSPDDGRVQADFARNVMVGENILLKSAGLAQRTYTYVADAVAGMFYAMLNGEGGAYNVSDENGLVAIRELAECFMRARPDRELQLEFEQEEDRLAHSPASFQGLDAGRLRSYGWRPQVSLADGISRFISHLEQS